MAANIREFGNLVRLEIGPANVYFVAHPDYVNHILVQHSQNYSRLTVDYLSLKLFMGESLVTTEGKVWQGQRQMLQPEFHNQKVNSFASAIAATAEDFMSGWRQRLKTNPALDVAGEMSNLALRIAARTLFSVDSREFPEGFNDAAVHVIRFSDENALNFFNFPTSFPTKRNRQFRAALGILNEVVYKLIRDHRANDSQSDLLSMLIHAANPETGKPLTDLEIRDQTLALLITGHETTGNALGWTLYQISHFPDVFQAAQREVDAVLGQKPPTLADIPKLSLLKRVLQESMRLYPPVWLVSRKASSEDVMDGYFLPQGAYLWISFYAIHRHPDFWEKPEQFNPDRFLPQHVEKRHKYAYLPFGAGPHMCIGRELAMLEMQIVFAMLLQKYRFELVKSHPVELNPQTTLRPGSGIQMKLYERN